ncbi:MAG: hypothetical protein E7330_02810 [Clostridiales bacterium]|nr:hypothetical protein [Clostridiales bacterium]
MKRNALSLVLLLALAAALLLSACGEKAPAGEGGAASYESLSEEDAINLIQSAYDEIGAENLPMMMNMPLDLTDMDGVGYHTGLSSVEGIDGIIISESGVGSIAYSLVYVRVAEGADSEAIRSAIADSIDPAKWICVQAETVKTVTLGTDVVLVMGAPDMVDTVMNTLLAKAEGSFGSIGEPVTK